MDRSVEVRLRLDISNYMRNAATAGRETDQLTARMAALDAAVDRVEASSARAAESMRQARTQTRGMGRDAARATPQITAAEQAIGRYRASAQAGSQSSQALGRDVRRTGQAANQAGNDIDRFSGRLGIAFDAVLTLSSGLVPIGAVAMQAAAGLAALGTSAVIGLGSAVLAFQGLGDAVGALQDYQDDPTADNLKAAREELDRLSPAARQFAMEFQKTRPTFSQIQDAAAEGWFPGLTQALKDADRLAPKLEKILFQSGQMGGALVADGVDSLASDRWSEFFEFVDDEVPSAMASLSRIIGNFTHGVAEMWMELDPGNDDFVAWLEDVASGFDDWASSSEGARDISDFLAYARESGPQVAEFFRAVGGALLGIVQAAAPLGGPTLAALTAMAEVVESIADSDIATPLLAAVAAMRLFARLQSIVAAGQARVTTSVQQTTRVTAAQAAAAQRVAASVNAANPWSYSGARGGHADYGSQLGAALVAPRARDVRAQQRAEAAMRRRMVVGGAGMTAGIGLLASGAASDIDATNTALLAMAGSMAGPVGAALGALAGMTLDAAAANNDLNDSLEQANDTLSRGNLADGVTAIDDARKKLDEFRSRVENNSGGAWDLGGQLGAAKNRIEGWFGDSDVEESEREYAALEAQQRRNQEAAADLARAMGMQIGPLDDSARSTKELQDALDAAQPAMDALGISAEDLARGQWADEMADSANAFAKARATFLQDQGLGGDQLNSAIDGWLDNADSASARAENYRSVIRSLAEDQGDAADQADRLREALSALSDPFLDAEEALDKQRSTLRGIRSLGEGDTPTVGAGFRGDTEGAAANRAITAQYKRDVDERLATMVAAGRGEEQLANAVAKSREQFIESGVAAGFSREQITRRADAIGLTPQLVETTFRELGVDAGMVAFRTLRDAIQGMPKDKRTAFRAEGIPKTRGEVDGLVAKYKLTERQRQALITLVDRASPGIKNVQGLLASVRDKTVTLTTIERRIQQRDRQTVGGGKPLLASGGLVTGPGTDTSDSIDARLSNWEFVQRAAAVRHYGVGFMNALNEKRIPREMLPGFAAGGLVGGRPSGDREDRDGDRGDRDGRGRRDRGPRESVLSDIVRGPRALNDALAAASSGLRDFKRRLRESEKSLQAETRRRDDAIRLSETVGSSLATGEYFGNGLAGFSAALDANTNDTLAGEAALEKARRKGLGGKDDKGGLFQFLAASGDLTTLQQLAAASPAQIRAYEQRYARLQTAQNTFGSTAVLEEYGKSIPQMTAEVKRLGRVVDRLEDRIEKATERGAERGTRAGTSERSRMSDVQVLQRSRARR